MLQRWEDVDVAFVRRRYDRIAGLILALDWLLFVPAGFRRRAVQRLRLKPGDCAMEIGCGTGLNLPYLREAVGPTGRVYGVDLSPKMLEKSRELCQSEGWTNVFLIQSDAAAYTAPEPLDGVMFGLSYNTMPHHLTVLRHAWGQVRAGGQLVIMDAKLPPGLFGRMLLPFSSWLMKRTMLGNPLIRPWEDLAALADDFEMEEFRLRSYYIARAGKPADASDADGQRHRTTEDLGQLTADA